LADLFPRETVERIKESQRIHRRRNLLVEPDAFEGNLTSEEKIMFFLQKRYQTYQFSASALSLYARCPLRFFLERVLGIRPSQDFATELTALEMGNFVHRVLYRFFAENEKSGRTQEALIAIAREEMARLPVLPSLLYDVQMASVIGNPFREGILPSFYEKEMKYEEKGPFSPGLFEVPFGRVTRQIEGGPHLPPLKIGSDQNAVFIRGVVDRVDFTHDGDFIIYDYKTGTLPGRQELEEGLALQLPLYLQAIHQGMKLKQKNVVPRGAAYWALKQDSAIGPKFYIVDKNCWQSLQEVASRYAPTDQSPAGNTVDDAMDYFNSLVLELVNGIRSGYFAHTTRPASCWRGGRNQCPFMVTCRLITRKQKWLAEQRKENEQLN